MLVLSRKCLESVVVGEADHVEPLLIVTVLEVKGKNVRLGFQADDGLPIHRREVWERIRGSRLPDDPAPVV